VAFIGYGNVGGSRAIEQLRQVVAELDMVSVRESVHILGSDMAAIRQGLQPAEVLAALEPRLELLVDGLLWWVRATRTARLEEGTATLGTLLH
jgi:NAD(P)H-dependent FMN reductase